MSAFINPPFGSDKLIGEWVDDTGEWTASDLTAIRCEILELVRRREEGVKEPGDPDDIHAFERRLNLLLDELCSIARRAP
jgi:hypothetical protein